MTYAKPEAYLPHRAPMVLLDEVVSIEPTRVVAKVATSQDGVLGRYLDPDGTLSNVFLIEIMAQTIGIWAGDRRQRLPVDHGSPFAELGLLLSVRHFEANVDTIPLNTTLIITMHQTLNDDQLAVFEGTVETTTGDVLAKGRLTVYQPREDEVERLFARPDRSTCPASDPAPKP